MRRIYGHDDGKRDGSTGCLYVPSFAAWALEQVSEGTGPMVVLSSGGAVAWSRVPALREVRPGDRPDRIARLCPEARIRVRDRSVEQASWEAVIGALHACTPFIAPSRPPWAWFGIGGIEPVQALAAERSVRIGLAADRATARLAAVRSADRHVLHVRPQHRRAFLRQFDVALLVELGFPDEMVERLRLFGFPALGSLERLDRRHLAAQFGADGEALYDLVHPPGDPGMPLHVPAPAVEVDDEPDMPVRDAQLAAIAGRLTARAVASLGERRTQRIVLEVHPDSGAPRRASRVLPEAHNRLAPLLRFVLRLLPGAVEAGEAAARVVLRFEALRHPDARQEDLFDARPAVTGAVRHVHRRWPGAVRRAMLRPHALMPEDQVVLEVIDPDGTPAERTRAA